MTKKQYLKKLEYCIQALPAEERNEALEYYSDYFDDAEDDDKVMQELGEPEDLAKTIIEKFTCVPAKETKKKKEEFEQDYVFDDDEKLAFSFSKEQVKNLGISLAAGDVVIKTGSEYKVETRGISENDFRCEINEAGTLIVENKRRFPTLPFFRRSKNYSWCPRFLITVPENAKLENMKIALAAGRMRTKELNLFASRTMIDVGAGDFEGTGFTSDATQIRCSMGNIDVEGKFNGFTKIDCGMGSIKLKSRKSLSEYSYDAKVGMGTIVFGSDKRSGFSQSYREEKKENHISIICGMGEVKINGIR